MENKENYKKMVVKRRTSLADAKNWVQENKKDGCVCPCCDRKKKVYKRALNAGMACELIKLFKVNKPEPEAFMAHYTFTSTRSGEISKLRHWGLVEQKEKSPEDENKRTSGYWRITQRGIDFVLRKVRVKGHIFMEDGKCVGYSNETTDIVEALGKKFDYNELMG